MYVDEGGDSGLPPASQTTYFALSGVIVHELQWQEYIDSLIAFRRGIKKGFGLKMSEEFHAAAFINRPKKVVRIKRHHRLLMIRLFADHLATLPNLNVINIVVDERHKPPTYDVFAMAWRALIQRFENTISHRNFPGFANPDERGMIICDNTQSRLVTQLRKMRRFNMVPSQFGTGARSLPLQYLVEDATFRDSAHAYFIQAADLCAFLLYQYFVPSAYIRRKAARKYLLRLQPVLCTIAASRDPLGIVRL
jgi:hypothetical protein